jgi:short-subunit dehydrogenase
MSWENKGKRVALITGAASGLGASFAGRLARAKFDLVLVDRQADRVQERADELADRFAVKTHVIVHDLMLPGAAASIYAQCDALGHSIDLLVNNAGFHLNRFFHELPWSEIEENLQLLLIVVLKLTHLFLPGMIQKKWGRIINVASVSGFMPGGVQLATYNAAKTFLIPFSEALDFELQPTGVRVTAVCPGFMRTDLFVSSGITEVSDSVPRFMWTEPDYVADRGFRAAMKGIPVYIPGLVNRAIVTAAKFAPRKLLRARSRIFHRAEHSRLASSSTSTVADASPPRQVALVTGATSGIGASLTTILAEAGFDIILVARREELIKRRSSELTGRYGTKTYGIVQDLTDPHAVEAILVQCKAFHRPIDLLVNNAGYPLTELFHRMSWPEVQAALQIYVMSVVQLTHALLPGMLSSGWGKIINIASMAAFEPGSYRSSLYSSSKAFVTTFSESIAAELQGTGVSVTAVCPGFTKSEWTGKNKLQNASVPDLLWMESDEVARAGLDAAMRGVPLKIVGTFPLRIISMMFQLAPRRFVGSFLSRKRRKMGL